MLPRSCFPLSPAVTGHLHARRHHDHSYRERGHRHSHPSYRYLTDFIGTGAVYLAKSLTFLANPNAEEFGKGREALTICEGDVVAGAQVVPLVAAGSPARKRSDRNNFTSTVKMTNGKISKKRPMNQPSPPVNSNLWLITPRRLLENN